MLNCLQPRSNYLFKAYNLRVGYMGMCEKAYRAFAFLKFSKHSVDLSRARFEHIAAGVFSS